MKADKLKLDFEKQTKNGSVVDILSNGLLDDPDNVLFALTFNIFTFVCTCTFIK